MKSSNKIVFLELLRAGLWGTPCQLKQYDAIDWNEVYWLAQEQTVSGLVLAGLELSDVRPPQGLLLQWIGDMQRLEQINKSMNSFIVELMTILENADITAVLVKGQGIAQCYDKPEWRSCGDIDLLLDEENYEKAFKVLSPRASEVGTLCEYNAHQPLTIDGWEVELHGSLRNTMWKEVNNLIDSVQESVLKNQNFREWTNGDKKIKLPRANEDVIFVFFHILQHLFESGIGLRQICDWCRLLWTYKDEIDRNLLEQRLKQAKALSEWRAFAALAVDYLGMPEAAMPLYKTSQSLHRKSERILLFVFEMGNMGHNKDYFSPSHKQHPLVIKKVLDISTSIHKKAQFFSLFPLDSLKLSTQVLSAYLKRFAELCIQLTRGKKLLQ